MSSISLREPCKKTYSPRLGNSTILLISVSPGHQKEAMRQILKLVANENFRLGRNTCRGHMLKSIGRYTYLLAIDSNHSYDLVSRIYHIHGIRKISSHCASGLSINQLDGFYRVENDNTLLPNYFLPYGSFVFLKIENHLLLTLGADLINFCKDYIIFNLKHHFDNRMLDNTLDHFDNNSIPDYSIEFYSLDGAYELLCIVRTKSHSLLYNICYHICHTISFKDSFNLIIDQDPGMPLFNYKTAFLSRKSILFKFFKNKHTSLFSMSIVCHGYSMRFLYDISSFICECNNKLRERQNLEFLMGLDEDSLPLKPCGKEAIIKYNKMVSDYLDEISKHDDNHFTSAVCMRVVSGNVNRLEKEIKNNWKSKNNEPVFSHILSKHHFSLISHSTTFSDYLKNNMNLVYSLDNDYGKDSPVYSIVTRLFKNIFESEATGFKNSRFDLRNRFETLGKDANFRKCLRKICYLSEEIYNLVGSMYVKFHRSICNNQLYLFFIPIYKFMQVLEETLIKIFLTKSVGIYTSKGNTDKSFYGEVLRKSFKHTIYSDLDTNGAEYIHNTITVEKVLKEFSDIKELLINAANIFEFAYDQFFTNSYAIGSDIDDSTYGFIIGYQKSLLSVWGLFSYLLESTDGELNPAGFCLLGNNDSIIYDKEQNIVLVPTSITHRIDRCYLIAHEVGHEYLSSNKKGMFISAVIKFILMDIFIDNIIENDKDHHIKTLFGNIVIHDIHIKEFIKYYKEKYYNIIFKNKFDKKEHYDMIKKSLDVLRTEYNIDQYFEEYFEIFEDLFCDLFSYKYFYSMPIYEKGSLLENDNFEKDPVKWFIITHFDHLNNPYSKTSNNMIQLLYRGFCVFYYSIIKDKNNQSNLDIHALYEEAMKLYKTTLTQMSNNEYDQFIITDFIPLLESKDFKDLYLGPGRMEACILIINIFNKYLQFDYPNLSDEHKYKRDKVKEAIVLSLKEWNFQRKMCYISKIMIEDDQEIEDKQQLRNGILRLTRKESLDLVEKGGDFANNPTQLKQFLLSNTSNKLLTSQETISNLDYEKNRRRKITENYLDYSYYKMFQMYGNIIMKDL